MRKERKANPVEPVSPAAKARVQRVAEQMSRMPVSRMDPNGSYTGRPVHVDEVPVQDADDL